MERCCGENFVYQNELKSLKKNCENLRKLYEEERFEKNSIQEGVKTQEKAEIELLNQQILKYREKVAYLYKNKLEKFHY